MQRTGLNLGKFILSRVAPAQQADLLLSARFRFVELNKCEGTCIPFIRTEYRLLGFDTGDWSILVIGIAVALLLLLI